MNHRQRSGSRHGEPRRADLRQAKRRGQVYGTAMDQRYVDTMRALKVVFRNLDYLDEAMSAGQRAEINRFLYRLRDELDHYLEAEDADEGLWIGEE